jgi:hypothetical protein
MARRHEPPSRLCPQRHQSIKRRQELTAASHLRLLLCIENADPPSPHNKISAFGVLVITLSSNYATTWLSVAQWSPRKAGTTKLAVATAHRNIGLSQAGGSSNVTNTSTDIPGDMDWRSSCGLSRTIFTGTR